MFDQVGGGVGDPAGGEGGAEIGGDERSEVGWRTARHIIGRPGHEPEEQAALHEEHHGQEGDEAKGHTPVQTPKPDSFTHR
jgi:hypothetical protein